MGCISMVFKSRRLLSSVLLFAFVVSLLVPAFVVPVSAADIYYSNLFDSSYTFDGQGYDTTSVSLIDGSPSVFAFENTNDFDPVETYVFKIKFDDAVVVYTDSVISCSFFVGDSRGLYYYSDFIDSPTLVCNDGDSSLVVPASNIKYSNNFVTFDFFFASYYIGKMELVLPLILNTDCISYLTLLDMRASFPTKSVSINSYEWEFQSGNQYEYFYSDDGRDIVVSPDVASNYMKEPPTRFSSSIKKYDLGTLLQSLQYSYYSCSVYVDDWTIPTLTGVDYLYYSVDLSFPGSLVYVDVFSDSGAVDYELTYFEANSVLDVTTSSSLMTYQVKGEYFFPIGVYGRDTPVFVGGFDVRPYPNYTDYTFNIDYGYRDDYSYYVSDHESSGLTSIIDTSRAKLTFKIPYSPSTSCVPNISFVCLNDSYANGGNSLTSAGVVPANDSDDRFRISMDCYTVPPSALVSVDTDYLASVLKLNHTELMVFLRDFFPSTAEILELEESSAALEQAQNQMSGFESDAQGDISGAMGDMPDVVNGVGSFAPALLFCASYLQGAFSSLGSAGIVFILPLVFGIFFYLCSRVPSSTRGSRSGRDSSDKKIDKGDGDS